MSRRNAIQQAFDRFGRECPFERRSGVLYRRSDEVIALCDLQKSQYGHQYYVNQAFWLRSLADELYPKEWRCHVRVRLGALLPEEAPRLNRLLDLEHHVPEDERVGELVEILKADLYPLIERGLSLSGLRTMLRDGTLAAAAVVGPALEVLAPGTETGGYE